MKVVTFLVFILLIWLRFLKIETKNFNWDPYFFNLVKLEQYHLLHLLLTVYTLEEVRRWQQSFVGFLFWKMLCKVKQKVFRCHEKRILGRRWRRGGGGGRTGTRNSEIPTIFFRKYRFTVRFFSKYQYWNTFSYFIVSLPRLAWSTPTKSYQNK